MTELTEAPRTYAPQNQRTTDRIITSGQLIEAAADDEAIAIILATVCYDAAGLAAGLA